MYDLIIIGGGPAGVSGAVYAARKQLNTLLIAEEFGGQSQVSETIYNWIGSPEISGHALKESFEAHVRYYEGKALTIKKGARATAITKTPTGFSVTINNEEAFETKTILLCLGSSRRKLEAINADKLEHKGLTYCASCDGPLFSGSDVIVVGGGNAGFETAAQLLAYTKSVTLINRGDTFRADELTVESVLAHENMHVKKNTEIIEVLGDNFVSGVKIKNNVTGEIEELPARGIFVEVGQVPNTNIVKDVVELDEYGKIKVDPRKQSTSTLGIWAAGDCTDGIYHQNNIASGDAVKALEDLYMWVKTRAGK